jgi:hypothetical protein
VPPTTSNITHHGATGNLNATSKNGAIGTPNTGLTMIDFVALPARARITVSYSAQGKSDVVYKGTEGFFGLRKL